MPQFEPLHLPTLTLVIGVVLFMAAAIMTLVGVTQRTYRGYWFWTAAQWANMISALTLFLHEAHPWMIPLSVLLSLQWPLTMLAGMRQFYIRSNFRTPPYTDLLLLIGGFLAYVLPDRRRGMPGSAHAGCLWRLGRARRRPQPDPATRGADRPRGRGDVLCLHVPAADL